ncbi:hypothetical protein CC2G_006198 [Coprinopsis cinerea AmutBmut pab1-1]|nr:hypothetical protein CC2G_006198 [Coprinopsis cinerea AmutBmut pab1-1]
MVVGDRGTTYALVSPDAPATRQVFPSASIKDLLPHQPWDRPAHRPGPPSFQEPQKSTVPLVNDEVRAASVANAGARVFRDNTAQLDGRTELTLGFSGFSATTIWIPSPVREPGRGTNLLCGGLQIDKFKSAPLIRKAETSKLFVLSRK